MGDPAISIPSGFRGLDPHQEIRVYRRNLPHWRQDGATYFVTFRLADALPQCALRDLELESSNFKAMVGRESLEGTALREATNAFYKNYGRLLDHHLDAGSGSCVLNLAKASAIVLDALTHFHDIRYLIFAAVVMPNHCHVLVKPFDNHLLEDVLESWKGFTARKINELVNRRGSLWQSDNFDRIVRDEDHFRKAVRYIRDNPLKAGLPEGTYRLWESV